MNYVWKEELQIIRMNAWSTNCVEWNNKTNDVITRRMNVNVESKIYWKQMFKFNSVLYGRFYYI